MTTTISGGKIDVTASDDGINCAGGSDTGSNERSGRNEFAAQEGVYLKITGGELTVNSNGDGLDSNGDLYVEGGTTVVYGPTNSGNGAMDYGIDAIITGGTVLIAGSAGMAESLQAAALSLLVQQAWSRTFPTPPLSAVCLWTLTLLFQRTPSLL